MQLNLPILEHEVGMTQILCNKKYYFVGSFFNLIKCQLEFNITFTILKMVILKS